MRASRVLVAALVTAVVAVLATFTPVSASQTASETATFRKVTAYFSQTYATRKCGSRAYKILDVQYRFYRATRDRGARVTEYKTGQGSGMTCGGVFYAPNGDASKHIKHDVCFGCNGNGPKWSRTYSYSYNMPYMRNADWAFMYSKLKYRVYLPYSGGRSYYPGAKCMDLVRWGGSVC
jgi:hypothetical protein